MEDQSDDITEEATDWRRFRRQNRPLTDEERTARREQVRLNRKFQRELDEERRKQG